MTVALALGHWRRGAVAVLLALGLLGGTPAPAQSASSAAPLTIAASRGPVSLLLFIADSRQFFHQEGVDVRFLRCSAGRECLKLMAEGLADAATAAELAVLFESAQRPDLAIVATLSSSSQQIKLVARRSAGVRVPADLAGKQVGTAGGTSAQYFLSQWLTYHGIAPGQLQTRSLAPEQLVTDLVGGRLDAIAIWEPLAGAALRDLRGDGLLLPLPRVYQQQFTLSTTRSSLRDRAEAWQRLLKALLRAQKFVADEPVRTRQLLAARLGTTPEDAEAMIGEHDFRLRLDHALASTLQAQARWAVQEGLLRREVQALALPEPGPLQRLAPGAVTLVAPAATARPVPGAQPLPSPASPASR